MPQALGLHFLTLFKPLPQPALHFFNFKVKKMFGQGMGKVKMLGKGYQDLLRYTNTRKM